MKRNFFILLLASVLVVILVVLIGVRESSKVKTPPNPTPQAGNLNEFKSDILDFTIQASTDYSMTEKWTAAEITSDQGSIQMGRNANSFSSLREYLQDTDKKNNTEVISDEKELMISDYPAATRVELRGAVYAKFYYIYVGDWIYVFSTQSKPLYDDLDQIAQSFRYIP